MLERAAGGWRRFALGLASLCLTAGPIAQAGDISTLSGRTFQQVRLVRVDPDGVTWEHATGICKVNFTDLPGAVRQQYHYDAARAAAYQAAQARNLQQAAAQAQEDQRRAAARRLERFRLAPEAAASEMDAGPGTFVYRRARVPEKAAEALGGQIDTRKAALEKRTEHDGTIFDRRLWAIPQMIVGLTSDGHAFDLPDVNSPAYRRSLRRAPADKVYYEDVDRAAAFARGQP